MRSGRPGENKVPSITKKNGPAAVGEKQCAKHRELEQNFQFTCGKKKLCPHSRNMFLTPWGCNKITPPLLCSNNPPKEICKNFSIKKDPKD